MLTGGYGTHHPVKCRQYSVAVWGMFYQHTLGPLGATEESMVHLNFFADQVHPNSDGHFQHENAPQGT